MKIISTQTNTKSANNTRKRKLVYSIKSYIGTSHGLRPMIIANKTRYPFILLIIKTGDTPNYSSNNSLG
jgi:hypothetical protein